MKLASGALACALTIFEYAVLAATVTVEAPQADWEHAVVEFKLPKIVSFNAVKDSSGKTLPLQVENNGHAAFQIAKPGAGERFELVEAAVRENIKAEKEGKKLQFSAQGKPLLQYQAEPGEFPRQNIKELFRRGGYIHPIFSPSGKVITDDFPPNHIHHHGVWFAWSNAEFEGRATDFWNMGDGKGKVEFAGLGENWSGPVYGGFRSRHRYVDLTAGEPKTALNEDWEVRIYSRFPGEQFWIFDLICTQRCATKAGIKLPEYRYGGIGFRGNWAWNGADACHFLTSDGITDRIKGHATHGRWCDISGAIDGQECGIAILGHPDNFR